MHRWVPAPNAIRHCDPENRAIQFSTVLSAPRSSSNGGRPRRLLTFRAGRAAAGPCKAACCASTHQAKCWCGPPGNPCTGNLRHQAGCPGARVTNRACPGRPPVTKEYVNRLLSGDAVPSSLAPALSGRPSVICSAGHPGSHLNCGL